MIDLVLTKYRILAACVLAAALCAASASAAWVVNGWRLDAKHSSEILVKNQELASFKLALADQNGKVSILGVQKENADRARVLAEEDAKRVRASSKTRVNTADAIIAVNCNTMLEKLKGVSR